MSTIYFGTKDMMSWVPAPKINMPRTQGNWSSKTEYLNGGSFVNRSDQGARVYEMEWALKPGEDIDVIHAYAEGAYGDGPFYFLDPQAMYRNLAPSYWAHAALACGDGPNLAGADAARPALVTTASNTQKYPVNSAQYTLTGTETPLELWVPVPAGYTIHIGAHGSATGSAVVTATTDAAVATNLTLLGANTTTRTNYTLAGENGVTLTIGGTGTLTLAGLIIQVLPTGDSVAGGEWILGKGHSGCEFDDLPEDIEYSAALNFQAATATLTEVQAWL